MKNRIENIEYTTYMKEYESKQSQVFLQKLWDQIRYKVQTNRI